MTRWPIRTLGEIADRSGGVVQTGPFGSQLHSADYTDGDGVVLVMPKDMVGGRIDYSSAARVNLVKAREMSRHACEPLDVLLARRGDIGRCALVHDDDAGVLCGTGSIRVSVQGSELDPTFLFYFVSSRFGRAELESRVVGATMANLSASAVRMVLVPAPPLDTQRKIAAVLSAYDGLIDNNCRRIAILDEMAQRIYREWFVDFRSPDHEALPLVESSLGLVPGGWEIKTLGDVCARITDGAHASPPSADHGLPMASVKDMGDFSLDIEGCRRISSSDFEALERQGCRPKRDDVLISKDGAKYLEKVFPVFRDEHVVLLSSIAILRPGDMVMPTFLALMAKDPQTRLRMKSLVSGAAIPRVVLKDLKNFSLAVPPLGLQRRFDEVAGSMLRLVIKYETSNRKLQATRDLLLQCLMSGQIEVDDLDTLVEEAAA